MLLLKKFLWGFLLLCLVSCGVSKSLHHLPETAAYSLQKPEREQLSDSTFTVQNNFLQKNQQGLWELYASGNPLQLGTNIGALTQELYAKQEDIFFSKIKELVPSKGKQKLLSSFLAWYNRKIYLNVTEEYKTEIYGLSQYADSTYNDIAPPYLRALYLHGAHDIGHAMQDLAMVGCTSFAAWGAQTEDGELLIGRNFDFYAGDDFAKQKIIAFISPEQGHNYMSVTWPGMLGVVSGMNSQGLTVTINAGKSKIPWVAKTPISLVTKEILQYASTIAEAVAIAKKRAVFVSESILVGSAKDKRAVLIEVSPQKVGVYTVDHQNYLICANHFQSDAYAEDKRNQKHIEESHSAYRFKRMQQLVTQQPKLNPSLAVDILRNKEGLEDQAIGYGNEKALNQLLAHHAVVFQPEKQLAWVSSAPYQLGAFVAYDLKEIFSRTPNANGASLQENTLRIAPDPFLKTTSYTQYESYRVLKKEIENATQSYSLADLEAFTQTNPEYWEAYYVAGKYLYTKGYYRAALPFFETALEKEVTTVPDKEQLSYYIKKINRKLAK